MSDTTTEWETVDREFSDGEWLTIRQRWVGCEPPGPIGSGVRYINTHHEWRLADDGVWELTVYAWRAAAADDPPRTA